jgi:hypothetical protein
VPQSAPRNQRGALQWVFAAAMTETTIPAALTVAIEALWRVPSPGPDNLLTARRFVQLRDTCDSLYPKAKSKDALGFALSNALRALGLPCELTTTNSDLALPAEVAAARLDAAFRRKQALRVYLCPLDMADDLPLLNFGPNRIRTFTAAELEALVDHSRLKRISANWTFDAERFSEFRWLVVEKPHPLDREPGARAAPLFFKNRKRDWGRIEPHRERFPAAVEAALFAVLLAPWEGAYSSLGHRGRRVRIGFELDGCGSREARFACWPRPYDPLGTQLRERRFSVMPDWPVERPDYGWRASRPSGTLCRLGDGCCRQRTGANRNLSQPLYAECYLGAAGAVQSAKRATAGASRR